jgi:hypothetical protein
MLLVVMSMARWFSGHQDQRANCRISIPNITFRAAVNSFILLVSNLWDSIKLFEGPKPSQAAYR